MPSTTPAIQAMNANLLRNLWSYREVQDGGVEGGVDGEVDQGEETESAYEEDEDVEMEEEEEVQEEVNASPPPPEVEVEVEVEVAAKEKKSPKIHIPVRIWNEVVPGGKVRGKVNVPSVQAAQDPKVDSSKRKRVSLVLHHDIEASGAEAQEQEAEAQVEERGRRKRTKTFKASQNEEISRAKTSGASRSRGHAASASTSRPASRTAAATATASRSHGSESVLLSASALALETAARTLKKRAVASSYLSSSTEASPPTTPPISTTPPPKEGPRAAWHRLFPHLPSLSDYYHIGEWRELMVWKEAKGWIKRAADDPWEKPVFRKPGWNKRDEEHERLWEGCERRMVRERGWTYEGRVKGDEGMVRAAERGWGVGGWEG
ncbi:uncharacterized protein J4E88_010603 [Alternaria novae-zelandiae]|uniref:uncharacterized protein n=1 Tax=Alternaria novae-zelandiae TaxID=430562 RepID=UPI0020C3F6F6|nr:uncharacterized protein J4E88_010603 [Alternaria novae-zelandiae]KAI4665155.1 hypothetical protein J4E88_010603 [Alternaria novae-zelandiae]